MKRINESILSYGIVLLFCLIVALFMATGCSEEDDDDNETITTTTTSIQPTTTTTTISADFDCPDSEPIGCIDPDYSTDQYWCCEEDTACGKVECDEDECWGTCIPVDDSQSSTTTTAQTAPDETTLYLSPDSESDLLFYIHHKDGNMVYYNGFNTDGIKELTHVSFDDGSAIIFNDDFIPVQWILDDVTVAVYVVDDEEQFDPHNAYHEIADGTGLSSVTIDIYPDDLSGIVTQMEAKIGQQFSGASAFLLAYSISSFSDLVVLAKQPGSDQPRFIAAAVGFSAAAAYLSMEAEESASLKIGRISASTPLEPVIKYAVQFVVSLFAAKFNEEFGPQPPIDPDDPGVEVLLCRGQSSISQICHYMFFKRPGLEVGPCIVLCLTSMKCFTNICMPKTLSSQSAEDFRNHFYN